MGVREIESTALSDAVRACNQAELIVAAEAAECESVPEVQAYRRAGRRDATVFTHASDISRRMPKLFEYALSMGTIGARHLDIVWSFSKKYFPQLEGVEPEVFDEWTENTVMALLRQCEAPTTGEVKDFLERNFADVEPEAFRRAEVEEKKRTSVQRDGDTWRLKMTAQESQRLWQKIDKQARERMKETEEEVSTARMKVILGLLDGQDSKTVVHVHVFRQEGGSGWIPGVGTISTEEADYLQTFADSVEQLEVPAAVKRYQPSQAQRIWVMRRDRTCRFPGCEHPSSQCDIDHIREYNHDDPESGGATSIDNLQCLCRYHHNLKTNKVWKAWSDDGWTVHWAGPDGQILSSTPHME